jgi:nucleoside-diphosphate-sugar epimerase
MKVLVTGAGGFLGQTVTKQLILLGHEVYGLSRIAHNEWSEIRGLNWVTADLFSLSDLELLMKKHQFEGLVHLAWDTNHGTYWQSNNNLRWVAASLELFEAFRIHGGKRIVVAGSSAEYQWGVDPVLDEITTKKLPSSLYGVSKNVLRLLLETWAMQNAISWGWGCIFNIFGPFEKKERLIPKCIDSLLRRKIFQFDDGLIDRDFFYVDDAGAAFAAFFDSNVGGVVNIASGQATSVRHVLQIIADLLEASDLIKFGALGNNANEPVSVVASIDRLEKEVGWLTKVSLQDRLSLTCDWWKSKIL